MTDKKPTQKRPRSLKSLYNGNEDFVADHDVPDTTTVPELQAKIREAWFDQERSK